MITKKQISEIVTMIGETELAHNERFLTYANHSVTNSFDTVQKENPHIKLNIAGYLAVFVEVYKEALEEQVQ